MNKQSAEQGDFLAEAQLALDDLGEGIVAEKRVSKRLNNEQDISKGYLNIRTNADMEFCIELTQEGYRVVGYHFDDNNQPSSKYYESLQALLTNESKSYVDSFAQSLQEKLFAAQSKLQQENEDDDDDDDHAPL